MEKSENYHFLLQGAWTIVLKVNFPKTYNCYFVPPIHSLIWHIVITLKFHCYCDCGCLHLCGVRKDSRQYKMASANSVQSQQLTGFSTWATWAKNGGGGRFWQKGKRRKRQTPKTQAWSPRRGPPKTHTINPKLCSRVHKRETKREYNRNQRERKKRRESGDDDTVEHCDEGELTEEEAGEGMYCHRHHHDHLHHHHHHQWLGKWSGVQAYWGAGPLGVPLLPECCPIQHGPVPCKLPTAGGPWVCQEGGGGDGHRDDAGHTNPGGLNSALPVRHQPHDQAQGWWTCSSTGLQTEVFSFR